MVDVKKTRTTTFKSDDVTVQISQGDSKQVVIAQGDNAVYFSDKGRFRQFCEDALSVVDTAGE
jgi:hypothetical protein